MKRAKKKVKSVSKLLPSSSSNIDKARPKSVCVVLHFYSKAVMCILQLETPVNNLIKHDAAHLTLKRIEKRHLQENDYVECIDFNEDQPDAEFNTWLFSPPTSPNSLMYILPKHGKLDVEANNNIYQFPGYIYNINNGEHQMIESLPSSKCCGQIVNCRGLIYFLANPDSYYPPDYPTFEFYDLDKGKWVPLQPFPQNYDRLVGGIRAAAVWDDTILYTMERASEFWAYNVSKNKWYLVQVIDQAAERRIDNRCYTIYGKAVVLNNTIYALTLLSADVILELSIESKETDGDFAYKCTLVSKILVPGLRPIGYNHEDTCVWSRHLVHLGEDDFCLVQSCYYFMNKEYQPIQLTSIKLVEKEGRKLMTVTGSCLYEVFNEIDGPGGTFKVALCFSLPEDTGPKPGQASTVGDGAASKCRETDDEGHYVHVRNLPAEATKVKLKKKLKKFGPIKSASISTYKNEEGKCSAIVEFESAISKQRAIEASSIIIGGGCADIIDVPPLLINHLS